jgi:hypothetical protein
MRCSEQVADDLAGQRLVIIEDVELTELTLGRGR